MLRRRPNAEASSPADREPVFSARNIGLTHPLRLKLKRARGALARPLGRAQIYRCERFRRQRVSTGLLDHLQVLRDMVAWGCTRILSAQPACDVGSVANSIPPTAEAS